jgi:hypothetical protein
VEEFLELLLNQMTVTANDITIGHLGAPSERRTLSS